MILHSSSLSCMQDTITPLHMPTPISISTSYLRLFVIQTSCFPSLSPYLLHTYTNMQICSQHSPAPPCPHPHLVPTCNQLSLNLPLKLACLIFVMQSSDMGHSWTGTVPESWCSFLSRCRLLCSCI